jgi:acetyltransferase-like isoleucine patch superfamily enzyme
MEYSSIRVENEGRLAVGERARFVSAEARTLLQVRPGAKLVIGARALINSGVTITAASLVLIGDDVKIGSFAAITDSGGHEVEGGGGVKVEQVIIEDNVWIGRGAFILPGVKVGANSVVGAGSVVTSEVPADTVVGGAPARIIRRLNGKGGVRA